MWPQLHELQLLRSVSSVPSNPALPLLRGSGAGRPFPPPPGHTVSTRIRQGSWRDGRCGLSQLCRRCFLSLKKKKKFSLKNANGPCTEIKSLTYFEVELIKQADLIIQKRPWNRRVKPQWSPSHVSLTGAAKKSAEECGQLVLFGTGHVLPVLHSTLHCEAGSLPGPAALWVGFLVNQQAIGFFLSPPLCPWARWHTQLCKDFSRGSWR